MAELTLEQAAVAARLFGKPVGTAGAILAHLDARLEAAKRTSRGDRQTLFSLSDILARPLPVAFPARA